MAEEKKKFSVLNIDAAKIATKVNKAVVVASTALGAVITGSVAGYVQGTYDYNSELKTAQVQKIEAAQNEFVEGNNLRIEMGLMQEEGYDETKAKWAYAGLIADEKMKEAKNEVIDFSAHPVLGTTAATVGGGAGGFAAGKAAGYLAYYGIYGPLLGLQLIGGKLRRRKEDLAQSEAIVKELMKDD